MLLTSLHIKSHQMKSSCQDLSDTSSGKGAPKDVKCYRKQAYLLPSYTSYMQAFGMIVHIDECDSRGKFL